MGYRLSKIYTRTGDKGETGLADGRRVGKDHPRIEAIGEVDTLNSQLGLLLADLQEARGQWPGLGDVIEVLAPCQHRLFEGQAVAALNVLRQLTTTEQLFAGIDNASVVQHAQGGHGRTDVDRRHQALPGYHRLIGQQTE